MSDDRLKRLIEAAQSPTHRERFGARFAEASHANLEHEMAGEMASALGRAGDKMARALAALLRAESELDAADAAGRAAHLAVYETFREQALRARWELHVHREALGLYRHDDVEALYPIPPRRK